MQTFTCKKKNLYDHKVNFSEVTLRAIFSLRLAVFFANFKIAILT